MMVVGLFYERVGRGATYHFRPQTKKTHFMEPGLVIWSDNPIIAAGSAFRQHAHGTWGPMQGRASSTATQLVSSSNT